jgi:hypothetical protein
MPAGRDSPGRATGKVSTRPGSLAAIAAQHSSPLEQSTEGGKVLASTPAEAAIRASRPSSLSRYSTADGMSAGFLASASIAIRQAASGVLASCVFAGISCRVWRRRAPSTRSVVSVTVTSTPPTLPLSSRIGL